MVTGPAGLPTSGGLSSGPEQNVSVECLHGNGAQPFLLLSARQQVFCRHTSWGDGGGGGWSLPGPTDDHTPGPTVDREPEDIHLHSLCDMTLMSVTSLPVVANRSPAFYCLRWDTWTRHPIRNGLAWLRQKYDYWGGRMTRMTGTRWDQRKRWDR